MMGYEGGDLLLTGAVWPTVRSLLRPVCAGCGWWPGWPAALVSDERALEAEERRTTGLTAGLTAYATMRYTNRRSLPFTFFSCNDNLDGSRFISCCCCSCYDCSDLDNILRYEGKKGKVVYSISQLRSVTCHMGSHSQSACHPTQVNTAHLNPSQTGRYSIYLPRRDGRLS